MIVEFGGHRLQLVQGDITQQQVEVIVNAANTDLAGGGGVDGAIHRAAGPAVMAETGQRYPEGCPTGDCVETSAGQLSARFLRHAVGPIWKGGHRGDPELLRSAYRNCLNRAEQLECRSMAFPALSTGAYGYPIDLAAETTLGEIRQFLSEVRPSPAWDIRLVLFDRGAYAAFARVLETMVEM